MLGYIHNKKVTQLDIHRLSYERIPLAWFKLYICALIILSSRMLDQSDGLFCRVDFLKYTPCTTQYHVDISPPIFRIFLYTSFSLSIPSLRLLEPRSVLAKPSLIQFRVPTAWLRLSQKILQ